MMSLGGSRAMKFLWGGSIIDYCYYYYYCCSLSFLPFCDLLLCCCWSRKICSRDSNKINNYVARGRIHWESQGTGMLRYDSTILYVTKHDTYVLRTYN
jgi:hypothetical protein